MLIRPDGRTMEQPSRRPSGRAPGQSYIYRIVHNLLSPGARDVLYSNFFLLNSDAGCTPGSHVWLCNLLVSLDLEGLLAFIVFHGTSIFEGQRSVAW